MNENASVEACGFRFFVTFLDEMSLAISRNLLGNGRMAHAAQDGDLNIMDIWHKSEPRSYAIGLMAKDENSERERREKKKQCAELTACDSSSIPHHVIDYQSGSMVSLWG